jgi:hypothetical protein
MPGCWPSKLTVTGATIVDLPHARSTEVAVLPVEFTIVNPNARTIRLEIQHLQIVQKAEAGERILAEGSVESPLDVLGSAKGHETPSRIRANVLISTKSWDPDVQKIVTSGKARLVAHVRASIGRWGIPLDIDEPLDRLAGKTTGGDDAGESPVGTSLAFSVERIKRLHLKLPDRDHIEARVILQLSRVPPSAVQCLKTTFLISARAGSKPLAFVADEPVTLVPEAGGEASLKGRLDLASCDPSILDSIEHDGRRAKVRLQGTCTTAGLTTNVDVSLDVELPPDGKSSQSTGDTEVVVEPPSPALLVSLVEIDRLPRSLFRASADLGRRTATIPMPVRNPLPGTVILKVNRLAIVGPGDEGAGSRSGAVLLSASSAATRLAPRTRDGELPMDVKADVSALAALPGLVLAALGGGRLRGYNVVHDDEIMVPLFGKVDVHVTRPLDVSELPLPRL